MSDSEYESTDEDDEEIISISSMRLGGVHHFIDTRSELPEPQISVPVISDNLFDFGNALADYPILDVIFSYLDKVTLRNCCRVCKSWNIIAKRSISLKPLQPRFAYLSKPFEHYLLALGIRILHTNISSRQIEPTFTLVFFLCTKISLEHIVCIHEEDTDFCGERITFAEYLQNRLFPRSELLALMCRSLSSYLIHDDEPRNGKNYLFNGLSMPHIPNIRNVCFRFQKKADSAVNVINDALQVNENIECLLMFNMNFSKRNVQTLISAISKRQNISNLAMGGGTVRGGIRALSSHLRRRNNYSDDIYCVAFLKHQEIDADFNAHSYVISRSVKEKREELEKHFIKLRAGIVLRKYGTVFRFACVSRKHPELEIELFADYFPKYPLIGFDGDGEIGSTVLESQQVQQPVKKKQKRQNKYTHLGASVYVFLTWGPTIK